MLHVRGVFRNFFREGASNFVTFSNAFFPTELILSNLSNKDEFKGSGGMLPGKILKIFILWWPYKYFSNNFQANFVYSFGP